MLTPRISRFRAGNPTGESRATLVVKGQDQSVAIYSACQVCDNISIQNIQVYGSWLEMGYNGGAGLIEAGGNTRGQTIKNCKLMYPRGWSALHGIGTFLDLDYECDRNTEIDGLFPHRRGRPHCRRTPVHDHADLEQRDRTSWCRTEPGHP